MDLYLMLEFDSPILLVWAACIGFNVAMIFTYVLKRVEGRLILGLIGAGAMSAETGITLESLGYKPGGEKVRLGDKLLCYLLRDGGSLRKIVSADAEKIPMVKGDSGRAKADYSQVRFYIEEKNLGKAKSLGNGVMKWYYLPIFTILSVIIAVAIVLLMPYIS